MNSSQLMMLGAIVVSVANSLAFFAALIVAYFSKDSANLTLLIGAVVANASSVISFWIGSSAGSARKTELLASQPSSPPPTGAM